MEEWVNEGIMDGWTGGVCLDGGISGVRVVTVCGVRQDGCGQEVGGVCVQMRPEKPRMHPGVWMLSLGQRRGQQWKLKRLARG